MQTFAEFLLTEGRYDPGIFKCVFMAGGPGSGKSYIASDIFMVPTAGSFSALGLKIVNSDSVFETLLAKAGFSPRDLATMSEPELIQHTGMNAKNVRLSSGSTRDKAQALTRKRYELFMQEKLGMIVDGTGNKIDKIAMQKEEAEAAGYDTFMIFVDTTLDTAQARNRARDRSLQPSVVQAIWEKCQENLDAYSDMFGQNFLVVNNNTGATDAEMMGVIRKYVASIIRRPVQNPIGQQWLNL
jgi:predicted kinase